MAADDRVPRQIPLEFSRPPGHSREELVVSAANAEAVALIDAWPNWPSNVVVIAGPVGSGKSHLASIWREDAGALAADRKALGPDVIHAVEGGAVLIDDADAGGLDENGLFHLINAARGGNGHVLLTARRFPAGWGISLPDLKSRLAAASTVEIREPDDLLLAGVITKLFADRQVEIDPLVVQFLVKRIERSLATAIRVVDRLDRLALETKSRITRQLAASMLGAIDSGQGTLDFEAGGEAGAKGEE
jgi:chromosomal replication initiation ATPase DnaA